MLEPTITREISPLPQRRDDAHKGDVGRIVIIGGSHHSFDAENDVVMGGAPALAANAAFRAGAGLVQVLVPAPLRTTVIALSPCATARSLSQDAAVLLELIHEFRADVLAVGPGLGRSLSSKTIVQTLTRFPGPIVVDADGLNLLAEANPTVFPNPQRIVLTPHPGELHRLLASREISLSLDNSPASRKAAVCALAESSGCTVVLKGQGTLVTNGERVYINDTGNSGMATAGTGDVLTGIIAALIGQGMDSFEGAVLGVYLHGLAGDFAAEELGRHSMTALDVIDYLPDAFREHEGNATDQA